LPTLPLLLKIVLVFLTIAIRKEEETKGVRKGKEIVKISHLQKA
jgi:hypothetical protein